jgi:two-component system, chemotaxis family, protein-glutamate methylesterase/glutaminase
MSDPVRVLVIDDSAVMRKLIPQLLQGDPSIQVVGTAMDGILGQKKIVELKPDVITLDLEMPRMDGMEALRQIMEHHHLPVIVVSAHNETGAYSALSALALGAFDFVAKPRDGDPSTLEQMGRELMLKIKVASMVGAPKQILHPPQDAKNGRGNSSASAQPSRVIALGVSTGGPNALEYIFSQLPDNFRGCLVIVQHMPEGFTEMLANRLNNCSPVKVMEARSGDAIVRGRAYICPGNHHMRIRRTLNGDIVILEDRAPVNGHRPSVDVLFSSMAKEYGKKATAILMTGMGDDGVEGLGSVQAAGGITMAQSPDSCVVDSMPRSAIERGYVSSVITLEAIPGILQTLCSNEASWSREELVDAVSSGGTDRESLKLRRRES